MNTDFVLAVWVCFVYMETICTLCKCGDSDSAVEQRVELGEVHSNQKPKDILIHTQSYKRKNMDLYS